MRLAALFGVAGPYLRGETDTAAALRALYGEGASAVDPWRLEIYQDMCRAHRRRAVERVFPRSCDVVRGCAGDAGWAALVEDFFRAHPMRHFRLHENGAGLPAFLAHARANLPPWLPEVADVEWWEWQTSTAPDAPEDATPDEGPLRLASTAELRIYRYDVVSWLDELAPTGTQAAPEPCATLVLFWRAPDLGSCRAPIGALERRVLAQVRRGALVDRDDAAVACLAQLREVGVALGTAG